MKNNSILLLIILILLGAASFFVLQKDSTNSQESEAGFLVDELQTNINDVNYVAIKKGKSTVTLSKTNDIWTIAESDNYFADANKIATLLMDLRNLKLKSTKTSNPDNYAKLDLSGDNASQIVLKTDAGQIADIVIGKTAKRGQGVFVRRSAENQTWVAEGKVRINPETKNWIVSSIIDRDANQIQSVSYHSKDKDALMMSKSSPTDEKFSLQNIPDKKQQKATADLNALANGLKKFTIESASPKTNLPEDAQTTTVEYHLFNGMKYKLTLYLQDEKHLMTIAIENDDGQSKIAKQLENWQFVIPQFKYDAMQKNLADFIEDIPPPAAPRDSKIPEKKEKKD